jgi:hypothetical protein
VRTLVVSDLHLGSHTERDLLRRPEALAALLAAVGEVDRLVLLGDILELRHGPLRDALSAARPVIEALGAALPAGAEVVIVPGNHDHHLLSGWLERRERTSALPALGLESAVAFTEEDPIGALSGWLSPARVRAAYPGVWLRDDVYATHGHYADRHTTVPMLERVGAGVMARVVREPDAGPRCAEDYEKVLAPIYDWIHAIAQRGGPDVGESSHGASAQAWHVLEGSSRQRKSLRRRGLIAAFPAVIAALNRARIGPLRSDISGPELRRAALVALGEVLSRLEVRPRDVIFGHTHRAGPLPGDERSEWRTAGGSSLHNTGCWVHEPSFLGPRPAESPYRAGFGVLIEDGAAPELRNLLDGVTLRAPA